LYAWELLRLVLLLSCVSGNVALSYWCWQFGLSNPLLPLEGWQEKLASTLCGWCTQWEPVTGCLTFCNRQFSIHGIDTVLPHMLCCHVCSLWQ
jgi:hypothetical protein